MNSRNPQILIGVLFILALGGIFAWQYFGKQKEEVKDETAGWKTYRNEEFGFEVRYPPEGTFQDALGGESLIFESEYGDVMVTPKGRWPGGGFPGEDAEGNTIEDNPKEEGIIISGIQAKKYSSLAGISIRDFETLPNENWSSEGEIRLQPSSSFQVLTQILSTFRFIEKRND